MPKRLVVCSDGTWNTPDQKDAGVVRPSNVVKMARAVVPQAPDGWPQVVFYDQGLGTHWGLDRLTGGAFGKGISKNIADAYRFLVDNYVEGDAVFLFGFSRGAYTVRSTAGLIRNCGLLHKRHADKFPEAYELYRSKNAAPGSPEATKFIDQYSRATRIEFVGVWDTVGALGIPVRGLRFLTKHRHQFHDVTLSSWIDNAYHALAIDERRAPFTPAIWQTKRAPGQRVEQVWFAGVHSNIGGGYKDSGLSDLAFVWMKEKAEDCGLAFDQAYIAAVIAPDPTGVLRDSKKGLYRLTKGHVRRIGEGTNSEESVHWSATERYNTDPPPYKPSNLTAYLESHPARSQEIDFSRQDRLGNRRTTHEFQ